MASRVADELAGGRRRICVYGPTGSGRSIFVAELCARLSDQVVAVSPPAPADADLAAHTLLQATAPLDATARVAAQDEAVPIDERARVVGTALARAGKTVALRLPSAWRRFAADAPQDPDDGARFERVRLVLGGLESALDLKIVAVVSHPSDVRSTDWERQLRLPRMYVEPEAAAKEPEWGACAAAARRVAGQLVEAKIDVSPLQFRLAVGLAALGAIGDGFIPQLAADGASLFVLTNRWGEALSVRPALARLAFRFALSRRAIPFETIAASAATMSDLDSDVVRHCLMYPHAGLQKMHEQVRRMALSLAKVRQLRASLASDADAANADLVRYHEQLDGTSRFAESPSPIDWLERVHHLAQGGPEAAPSWAGLDLRCRDFYWDRGRSLSRKGHYADAAKVFQQCIALTNGKDSYSLHYYAFNLDRTGMDAGESERAFRKAVDEDPSNPWWNSRLVTFLIGQARFLDARREWQSALGRLDESGDRVRNEPWLALHVHRWVAMEWLKRGEVDLAREVFDTIPAEIVDGDERLSDLRDRLRDAEEARALGTSVYPPATPPDERWTGPRRVPEQASNGSKLRAWYPARVVESRADGVLLVFAVPSDNPAEIRVKLRELSSDEWTRASRRRPESAAGFVEIGSYRDGQLIIELVDEPRGHVDRAGDEPDRDLRYLRRWRASE